MLRRKHDFDNLRHVCLLFSFLLLIPMEIIVLPRASDNHTDRFQRTIILSPNPVFMRENHFMNITMTQEGSFLKMAQENFLWEEESNMPILHVEAPGVIKGLRIGKTLISVSRNLADRDHLDRGIESRPQPRFIENTTIASADVEVLPAKNIPISQYKEVVAAYYPWFSERYAPPPPRPRFCEDWSIFTPTIKPYDPQSEDVVEQHIRMAKDGGIDAFAISWFTFRNKFDFDYDDLVKPPLENMVRLAPRLDFKVYILYESHMNLCRWNKNGWIPLATIAEKAKAAEDAEADFDYLLERLAPAEESPTIFVYLAEGIGLSPSDWLPLLSKIRAKYPKARFYAETYDLGYLTAFDGLFSYGSCFFEKMMEAYSRMSTSVKSYGQEKKFYATVGPGFDATDYWGSRELLILRDDGAYYQQTWQKALDSHPDGIFITSWNEWGESTVIEPSKEYGYKYIDITADHVIKFKQE